MNQVSCNRILETIKLDDLVLFSVLTEKSRNLCFGRFPLLTLCYLYGAKKIIKKYQNDLIGISKFNFVPENFEIYKKFKAVAGKSLRLYVKEDSVVTPLEMMAILKKDFEVKKLYFVAYKNEVVENNLTKIYSFNKQTITTTENTVKISLKPLNRKEKITYRLAVCLAAVFMAVMSGGVGLVYFMFGLSTNNSPFIINNEAQLYQALKTNGNYVLNNNLTLTNFDNNLKFNGRLNGNNYTITVNTTYNSLLKTNNGVIENLNVVYSEINRDINSNFSLLVENNNGTINNVKVSSGNINFNCNKQVGDCVYIGGIANKNDGVISNCSVKYDLTIKSNGGGEGFVSGVANENNNIVKNCLFNGSVVSNETDLSGIVSVNNFNATVENCVNNAKLFQTSSHNEWFPIVSGITAINYGTIKKCNNTAELKATSLNNADYASGEVCLGGIVSENCGKIEQCKNTGNIFVESKKIIVYCGGISAKSIFWELDGETIMSEINNCGAEGQITVNTTNDYALVFSGGISGYLYGRMINSYSLTTFNTDFNNIKYFLGTALGSVYYDLPRNTYVFDAANNYVLMQENVPYQVGASFFNGDVWGVGISFNPAYIVTATTENQIKSKEIYLNE